MAGDGLPAAAYVKAAGIITKQEETAGDALKSYHFEEVLEMKKKVPPKELYFPRAPYIPAESIGDVLSTELKKSRFVAFREMFSEDMYFNKPELGKALRLYSKPHHLTNENATFGDRVARSEGVYELVLPRKTPDEVNREYIKWHDKYVISHNHYLPSERINRHYGQNFRPSSTFGVSKEVDKSGNNVKLCLSTCDHLIVISKAQKGFLERSRGRLGQKFKRADFDLQKKDLTYGKPYIQDKCNVQALIENINPCVKKTKLLNAISHINKLRRSLFMRRDFHMYDLKAALEKNDPEKSGYLSVAKIFDTMRAQQIHINEEKINTAFRHFNLLENEGLKNERIKYIEFWKLLTMQFPLPTIGNISTMPDNIYNKETTYRELCKDLAKKPSKPEEPIEPLMTVYRAPKDIPTTLKDVIEPDIPMKFGLEPSDFEQPRPKEELRRIFKRLITDNFDEIWESGKAKLQPNHMMSVNAFREVMDHFLGHKNDTNM